MFAFFHEIRKSPGDEQENIAADTSWRFFHLQKKRGSISEIMFAIPKDFNLHFAWGKKKISYNSLWTMPHWWNKNLMKNSLLFFVVVIAFMFCLFSVLQHVSK